MHDRTISQVRYLPEEGLLVALALDNTMRIFNALQATVKRTVVNDTGGPFTGMEYDPTRSQVIQPLICMTQPFCMRDTALCMRDTALYMHDTAIHMHDTALHMHDTALYMHDTALHMRDTALYMPSICMRSEMDSDLRGGGAKEEEGGGGGLLDLGRGTPLWSVPK